MASQEAEIGQRNMYTFCWEGGIDVSTRLGHDIK